MATDNHSVLKRLQRQLTESQTVLASMKKEQDKLQAKIVECERAIEKVTDNIDSLKEQGGVIIVSEHALLRYLERIWSFNMEETKAAILPLEVERQVLKLGDGQYPVGLSHRVCVSGGVVTTVLGENER